MYRNVEFFLSPDDGMMFRHNREIKRYYENEFGLISYCCNYIETHYNETYRYLVSINTDSALNMSYHKFRIVDHFLRCNMSLLDTSKIDIDENGDFNLEVINCHLRSGYCKHENCICRPKRTLDISKREKLVYAQLKSGLSYTQIGFQLQISPVTVKHHCEAIRRKIGVDSNEKLIAFWYKHNLSL